MATVWCAGSTSVSERPGVRLSWRDVLVLLHSALIYDLATGQWLIATNSAPPLVIFP